MRLFSSLALLCLIGGCRHKGGEVRAAVKPGPEAAAKDAGTAPAKNAPPPETSVHFGESWYALRAEKLGVDAEEAKRRDVSSFSEDGPNAKFWDEQTAVEAASIWTAVCNECHEGTRRMEDAKAVTKPPKDWGHGTGYFFGRLKSHRGVYEIIRDGLPYIEGRAPNENMPAWGKKLAREQIWALVYWLESQSRAPSKVKR